MVLVGIISESPETAGHYGMAVRIAAIGAIGVQSAFLAYAPSLTKEAAEPGPEWKKRLRRTRIFAAMAAGSCLLATLIWYPDAAKTLAPKYEIAYWPAVILLFGLLIEAIAGPLGMILQAREREKQVIRLNVSIFIVFLITASGLIPLYGMTGAACSVVLAKLIRCVILLTMLHQTRTTECQE